MKVRHGRFNKSACRCISLGKPQASAADVLARFEIVERIGRDVDAIPKFVTEKVFGFPARLQVNCRDSALKLRIASGKDGGGVVRPEAAVDGFGGHGGTGALALADVVVAEEKLP